MGDVNASWLSGNCPHDVTACQVKKKNLFKLQFRHLGVRAFMERG